MRHSTVDQYAKESSFYPLDPRVKIITLISVIFIIALLKEIPPLLIAFVYIISILLISGIPFLHILKRYVLALPFILFAALSIFISSNLITSVSMFLRISTCVLFLILLSSTTPFFDLLRALQNLKVPSIFIILLMFTYRYFFVFIEEMHRMKLARKAKGFQGGKHLFDRNGMKTISYTAGMILIRAYHRGVRIYDALLVRGYDGEIKTLRKLKVTILDFIFTSVLISMSILLFYYDWRVII